MQSNLKDCPFCGGSDIFLKYNGARHGYFYYVECNTCGGRTRGACLPDGQYSEETEWDNKAARTVELLWNQRSGADA